MTVEPLRGKRVLVTGGGGFLGCAVCRASLAAGSVVHAVYRRPVEASSPPPAVRPWNADLTDPNAIRHVIRTCRPDVVLHAAGFASAARHLTAVGPAVRDNLLASANLLTAAAEAGVPRVVIAGSTETPTGVVDVAGVTPNSPYAASKYAEDCFARMFHRTFGLGVVIARLAVVYGPDERRSAKLVPYVAARLLAGQPAELTSGRRRVDWLYVDDAADALLACAGVPNLEGQTIDVGTGRLTAVVDVASEIARLVGRADLLKIGAQPDRPDEPDAAVNADATERATGWRAQVRLEEGLMRTIAWLRREGKTADPAAARAGTPQGPSFPSAHA